jgi:hypothetical protein
MPDGAAGRSTYRTMVTSEVTRRATDNGTFEAPLRFSSAAHAGNCKRQNCKCKNRLHRDRLLVLPN